MDETYTASASLSFGGVTLFSVAPFTVVGYNELTEEQIDDTETYPGVIMIDDFEATVSCSCNQTVRLTSNNAYSGTATIYVVDNASQLYLWSDGAWELLDSPLDTPWWSHPFGQVPAGQNISANLFVGDPNDECPDDGGGDPDGGGDIPPIDEGDQDQGGSGAGTIAASREFVTCLHAMNTEGGSSRLISGTRTRLYTDTGDGNHQMILALTDLCGAVEQEEQEVPFGRFLVDTIGNTLFIAHTESGFWTWSPGNLFSQDQFGVYSSAEPVDDLIGLGITEARAVCCVSGFVLIANFVEEGIRKKGTIMWCDMDDPRGWAPSAQSLARRASIGEEQEILSMVVLGEGVRVFTKSGEIWEGALVDNEDVVWRFIRIYRGPDALAYPYSIVNIGNQLLYLGHDKILALDQHDRDPRTIQSLVGSAAAIFAGIRPQLLAGLEDGYGISPRCPINRTAPWIAIGVFDASRKAAMWFWPSGDSMVPDTGLLVDANSGASCVLDYGATAGCNIFPSWRTTWRRELAEDGLCPAGAGINEGNPAPISFTEDAAAYLIHPDESDLVSGSMMFPEFDLRDVDITSAAPDGWLAAAIQNNECCVLCPPRSAEMKTVLASPIDKSIKELAEDWYCREIIRQTASPEWPDETAPDGSVQSSDPFNHPTIEVDEAVGVQKLFYGFLWQSDASILNSPYEKAIRDIGVAYESQLQQACDPGTSDPISLIGVSISVTWTIQAQVGAGNSAGCLHWQDDDAQPVECRALQPDDGVEREEYDGGLEPMAFRFNNRGVYQAVRIFGGGFKVTGPHLGPFAFSALTFSTEPTTRRW